MDVGLQLLIPSTQMFDVNSEVEPKQSWQVWYTNRRPSASSNFLTHCTGLHTPAHTFPPTIVSVATFGCTNRSDWEDTRVQLCQGRFDLTPTTHHSRAVMTSVGARLELRD